MKKYLSFLLLSFIIHSSTAQPKKSNAQNSKIIISVKAVEYDNPAFDALRKAIKGNIKVSQSSPGFAGDVATISLHYDGTATELWDELPQGIKQPFKITVISENRIDLQLKQNNTTGAVATEPRKDDCVDCYYYKSCGFDTSMVYNGNTYKGFKKRAAAYFCKDGILYSKSFANDKVYSQVIFKANAPVGTSWTDTFGSALINKTIVAKGSGLIYKSTYYDDAMVVYFSDVSLTALYYYAKGSGYIKIDTLDKTFNPSIASTLKGTVDTSLAGTWKYYNPVNNTSYFYQFYGDGTFTYYNGSISKYNQMPAGVSLWRAHDNSIEVYNGAWSNISQIPYLKKNDPLTGRPALAFGTGINMIHYVNDDGKAAWK